MADIGIPSEHKTVSQKLVKVHVLFKLVKGSANKHVTTPPETIEPVNDYLDRDLIFFSEDEKACKSFTVIELSSLG